jgi:uncharacterized Zn finger protein (UPF0148 family)
MKSCSVSGCIFPSWGKDKLTRLPYCINHQYKRTDIDPRSSFEKHIEKTKKKNKTERLKTDVRSLHRVQKEIVSDYALSALLTLADNLFGTFIKKRDADKNGNIVCPCCYKTYNLKDKDNHGNKIVQPLHYVSRKVYSHRYNTNAIHAGCCYCNKKCHDDPDCQEQQRYRNFMVGKLGNEAVTEIEDAKYTVNRISHSELQGVINKYSNLLKPMGV